MKILVTGGNGQLGRSLKKISGEYKQHDFIFTDLPEGDITNTECIKNLITDNNINILINCAAYTNVDDAEDNEQIAWHINTDGASVLAHVCKEFDVKLIHISTDYVFDGTKNVPITENEEPNPLNAYGRTKLAGETLIKESGVDAIIIRTAWLYSEFGNNFMKTMLKLAETKNEIRVVADQYGTPTYAQDLAFAIMKLLEKNIKGCTVYHFTDEGETCWWEFAEEIFRMADKNISVKPISSDQYPTKAHRPMYSVLDKTKIKNAGVFVPEWNESLKACLKTIGEFNITEVEDNYCCHQD